MPGDDGRDYDRVACVAVVWRRRDDCDDGDEKGNMVAVESGRGGGLEDCLPRQWYHQHLKRRRRWRGVAGALGGWKWPFF